MSRPIARQVNRGQTLPRTRYELPLEGNSLLGFAVRRMHKTARLLPVPELLRAGRPAQALAQAALYASEASSSFGPAYFRPHTDEFGATFTEADSLAGARVSAALAESTPFLIIDCWVRAAGVGTFEGRELIERTRLSLNGLTMPCRMELDFTAPRLRYRAELRGRLVAEIQPRLWESWEICAHGQLKMQDSTGNVGILSLRRQGAAYTVVSGCDETETVREADFRREAGAAAGWRQSQR